MVNRRHKKAMTLETFYGDHIDDMTVRQCLKGIRKQGMSKA